MRNNAGSRLKSRAFRPKKPTRMRTAAFIVGGLVGMGINYAANEDAHRGKLRDQCMAKQGYGRAKSG